MIDRDIPPSDAEQELHEFLESIITERFIHEEHLLAVSQTQKVIGTGARTRLATIPEFVRHIPGIANDVEIGFKASTLPGMKAPSIDYVHISTEDAAPIRLINDNGLYLMEDGSNTSLLPPGATETFIRGLFPQRNKDVPLDKLVSHLYEHSLASQKHVRFEDTGPNDSAIQVSALWTEGLRNNSMWYEIIASPPHPSGALVGTRLTFRDSLQMALNDPDDIELIPNSLFHIDVTHASKDGELTVESILNHKPSILVERPTRYHQGNIQEALTALELAARKSRQE